RSGFTNPGDVVFPYLRGGRGRGALTRVRNAKDLAAVRAVVQARGRAQAKR
ncbi:MAG: hypothetical protein HY261_04450, partial [Chloroflexi bacterium]|nr:hypothetical protein [Chloroflexota bacterium]